VAVQEHPPDDTDLYTDRVHHIRRHERRRHRGQQQLRRASGPVGHANHVILFRRTLAGEDHGNEERQK